MFLGETDLAREGAEEGPSGARPDRNYSKAITGPDAEPRQFLGIDATIRTDDYVDTSQSHVTIVRRSGPT